MISDNYIPRRLDDQWKIGFWDADVAFPFMLCLFIGWVSSSKVGFIICALTGLFLARLVARSKADKHPAFAMHWAYWSLPNNPLTDMKVTPPSHIRRMVG
jgi:conjugal transfer pilus assembly protein TraL